jgi:hypothetical protein
MASSGNFPTLNPLYRGQRGTSSNYYPIITQGNTRAHSSSNSDALQISTVENLKTGKWYWEWCIQDNNADKLMHSGAADSRRDQWDYAAAAATYGAEQSIHFHTYFQIVEKNGSDTGAYSSSASSHSVDDVFGIALDTDNGKFYVHKNGTYYASGNPATGANPGATWTPATEYTDGFTPYFTASGGGDADGILNFGQDSTFGGAISAGGNADGNGFGDFKYAPPTGFLAVCSANLPISDDIDPAQTDDNFPQKNFNTILYTGTGSSNAISGLGFQPDLVWLKQRGSSGSNMLLDTNRGTNARLSANNTNEERTASSYFTSFDSDGFTVTGNDSISNVSSGTFVGWCWRANGGTTASNSNGSITATVQANTAAGFSIATYTSPGSGTNHTVGHGLSDVDFIITKNRSSAFNWYCFHKSVPDKTYRLNDGGEFSYSNWSMGATTWGSEDGYTHNSTNNFVAYCWQNVEGFQKFGNYTGNGNSDGPFVYLGFRPALLVLKRTTSSGFWNVFDGTRKTFNSSANDYLVWNNSDAEANGVPIDFTSSGFKVRSSGSGVNSSGTTMIYMAWGSVPFKYANTF